MVGKTVKAAATVKAGTIVPPGGESRFIATSDAAAGTEVKVVYEGALPDGMTDGSQIILTGAIEADGMFVATDVALSK
jgi:cytochrome c-type biogenesis protein CcmE